MSSTPLVCHLTDGKRLLGRTSDCDFSLSSDGSYAAYRKLAMKWHPDKNQGEDHACAHIPAGARWG